LTPLWACFSTTLEKPSGHFSLLSSKCTQSQFFGEHRKQLQADPRPHCRKRPDYAELNAKTSQRSAVFAKPIWRDRKMSDLLASVIKAHGDLERWNAFEKVSMTIVSGGELWGTKGIKIDTTPRIHRERTSVAPYGGSKTAW
jgi:hypothetical protein